LFPLPAVFLYPLRIAKTLSKSDCQFPKAPNQNKQDIAGAGVTTKPLQLKQQVKIG
jgi:hypothetical protein